MKGMKGVKDMKKGENWGEGLVEILCVGRF